MICPWCESVEVTVRTTEKHYIYTCKWCGTKVFVPRVNKPQPEGLGALFG